MAHKHDENHPTIAPKPEYRDPGFNGHVMKFMWLLTSSRGPVQENMRQYDEMVEKLGPDYMERIYNSYNIPKEELLGDIEEFKKLLDSTHDLC
jgi:hypothetical protein